MKNLVSSTALKSSQVPVKLSNRSFLPGSDHPSMPSHISKNPTETFPLVLQPISNSSAKNISIKEWVKETEFWIEEVLHKYGAILVRGLPLSSADDFSHFIDILNYELMDYTSGTGIRNVVSGNVSTASNELSSVSLEPHNEMAYTRNYPSKILFFAQTPAPKGGEGVIVDVREYAKLLDPEIKQKLQETGIKYIRFLQDRRFGGYTSWQDSFLTNDKEVVIKFMNEHNYDFNWDENDNLTYSQVLSPIVKHPKTGEEIWFNQPHSHHASYFYYHPDFIDSKLEPHLYPFHCQLGDGTELSLDLIAHIRQKIWLSAVSIQWQKGDVLILDNLLVQHGRMSFEGPRQMFVSILK